MIYPLSTAVCNSTRRRPCSKVETAPPKPGRPQPERTIIKTGSGTIRASAEIYRIQNPDQATVPSLAP
ncbi:hypothetical protein FIBSPDRAFT_866066 [Athelia psychrophila]|uniref:Uncharacterized protein n=1 Tax=Athelia psychrophila TaxID=1759441 RepID=A0A166F304_9AGAM|nr:hypothetical protein FIBSPDRAFT_866066 [Fibularhizoctonia sp. CBS 109695]